MQKSEQKYLYGTFCRIFKENAYNKGGQYLPNFQQYAKNSPKTNRYLHSKQKKQQSSILLPVNIIPIRRKGGKLGLILV